MSGGGWQTNLVIAFDLGLFGPELGPDLGRGPGPELDNMGVDKVKPKLWFNYN